MDFLEGQGAPLSLTKQSNNRSVMPLDVRGRTRATLKWPPCKMFPAPKGVGNPLNPFRDGDWAL